MTETALSPLRDVSLVQAGQSLPSFGRPKELFVADRSSRELYNLEDEARSTC